MTRLAFARNPADALAPKRAVCWNHTPDPAFRECKNCVNELKLKHYVQAYFQTNEYNASANHAGRDGPRTRQHDYGTTQIAAAFARS